MKWGRATEWNGRESGFVGSARAEAGALHGRNGPARSSGVYTFGFGAVYWPCISFCPNSLNSDFSALSSVYKSTCMCLFTQLCPTLCDPMGCSLPVSSVHGNSPGKNTGAGCQVLLQRIFPTQGSNSGLPCCKRILYCLSYQGSPRILKWVAYPFSRETS